MSSPDSEQFDRRRAMADAAEALRARQATPAGLPSLQELQDLFPEVEFEGLIGRGGMGAVYRARDHHLDRELAIKILPAELAADPAFEERFQREARTLARLSHPHIVRLHDFGQRGDVHYLVTDFVDGVDLRRLLEMGQLPPGEVLRIISAICDALQSAHDSGVVHRDIKPENVLIDQNGHVYVADFGLAKLIDPNARDLTLTKTRQAMGTPHYMAPEQLRGGDVDHRADLFSLGVLFYEMLTGELPVGHFDPPSQAAKSPARLDEVVRRTLATDADARYQSASELRSAVESKRNDPPRLPSKLCRTPIVGVALFLISLIAVFGRFNAAPSEAERTAHFEELSDWETQRDEALAAGAEFVTPPPELDYGLFGKPGPITLLGMLAAIMLGAAFLTVSGAFALRQIRNSGGRLHGVSLAVLCASGPALAGLNAGIVFALWETLADEIRDAALLIVVPLLLALDAIVVIRLIRHQKNLARPPERPMPDSAPSTAVMDGHSRLCATPFWGLIPTAVVGLFMWNALSTGAQPIKYVAIALAVAFIATTVAGFAAIGHIRAARGRLHGLNLAVLCAFGPALLSVNAGLLFVLEDSLLWSSDAVLLIGAPLAFALDAFVITRQVRFHRESMAAASPLEHG